MNIFLKKVKINIINLCFISFIVALLNIFASYKLGLVTSMFRDKKDGVFREIIFTIFIFILTMFFSYIFSVVCGSIKAKVYESISEMSYNAIENNYLDNNIFKNTGDLYNKITDDRDNIVEYFYKTFPMIIKQGVLLISVIVYILYSNYKIGIIYICSLAISLVTQNLVSKFLNKETVSLKNSQVALSTFLGDIVNNRYSIKTNNIQDFIYDRHSEKEKDYCNNTYKFFLKSIPMNIIGVILGILPIVILTLCGMYFIPNKLITITVFMSIFYICNMIMPYQLHYIDLFIKGMKTKTSINRIMSVYEIEDKKLSLQIDNNNTIELKDVSYSYSNSLVLDKINLKIQKGDKVAFVGESGSGKSTALKLLSGEYGNFKGNIKTVKFTVVKQFPYFFNGTIRDNLSGFKNISDEKIISTLKYFNIYDLIQSLPDGLDTVLKNNGDSLSGGQKQRLAIVRGILNNSDYLIFDESLSAVDNACSKDIMEKLCKLKDKTIIFSTHNNSQIKKVDKIYLFKDKKTELIDYDYYSNFVGGDKDEK